MKYKLLIFDLDGTLVDTREDLAAAVNEMRSFYEKPQLPLKEVVSYVGDGARKLVERSLRGEDIDVDQALEVMLSAYKRKICVFSRIYDGCKDFIKKAKAEGVELAVLTNKPQVMTDLIMKELELTKYFSLILGPEGAGCHKPDFLGITKCLEHHHLNRSDALMVGDHHTDLAVAKNARIDAAFYTAGMGNDGGVEHKYSFDSYEQLDQLLF